MNTRQISLGAALLWTGALPLWVVVAIAVPQGTGWGASPIRFVIAPIVLVGITATVHRLLKRLRNAWAMSVVVAGVVALGALSIMAWLSG